MANRIIKQKARATVLITGIALRPVIKISLEHSKVSSQCPGVAKAGDKSIDRNNKENTDNRIR